MNVVPASHSPHEDAASCKKDDTRERAPIAAVVVYFRTPACLGACLEALRTQISPPAQITVVDNSSALDGLEQRPAAGRDWTWVRAERNLGFGAACNLGAQETSRDHLLFLNADVVLHEDACGRLLTALGRDAQTGVVGPRIYGADGRVELSARAFPTAATGLMGRSSLLTRGLLRINRAPSGVAGALGSCGRVDWVSGACMLVRREAYDEVGGFDEGYWMYWEDADLCRRLKDRGWNANLCPEAQAVHRTGSSGRGERSIKAFHTSAARYYTRHVARSAAAAKLASVLLYVRMRVVLRRYERGAG